VHWFIERHDMLLMFVSCKMQNSECRNQPRLKCEMLLQNQNTVGLWLLIGLSSVFAPYCINAVANLNPNRPCGSIHILPFLLEMLDMWALSTEQFERVRLSDSINESTYTQNWRIKLHILGMPMNKFHSWPIMQKQCHILFISLFSFWRGMEKMEN